MPNPGWDNICKQLEDENREVGGEDLMESIVYKKSEKKWTKIIKIPRS